MLDILDFKPFDSWPDLVLPPAHVSVYQGADLPGSCEDLLSRVVEALSQAWPAFLAQVDAHQLLAISGLSLSQVWELELIWVNNLTIQKINATYRHKDQPTDVLTFTLFADSASRAVLTQLPTVQLGSVLVSVEWAYNHVNKCIDSGNSTRSQSFIQYTLERVIHGCLHLQGVTHDTDNDYNRVVGIQAHVLSTINWSQFS